MVNLAMRVYRHALPIAVASAGLLILFLLLPSQAAVADNFVFARYDARHDLLVLKMAYRGTNAGHHFSLKWGACQDAREDGLRSIVAEVLDDQWQDAAEQEFQKTSQISLTQMDCRPAILTLRTAPRFYYTLQIPALPRQ